MIRKSVASVNRGTMKKTSLRRAGRLALFLIFPGILALGLLFAAPDASAQKPLPATVEFNRDIRPILSNNCFQCHGPDSAQRKAKLRLDQVTDALADRGGYAALIPGNLKKSELWQRLITQEKSQRMPPHKTGKHLTPRQIALLKRWIST
jgi:mono/diheme cytochrome c family protein